MEGAAAWRGGEASLAGPSRWRWRVYGERSYIVTGRQKMLCALLAVAFGALAVVLVAGLMSHPSFALARAMPSAASRPAAPDNAAAPSNAAAARAADTLRVQLELPPASAQALPMGAPSAPIALVTASPATTVATAAASASPAGGASAQDARVEAALQRLAGDADRVGQLLLLGWEGTSAETALPMLQALRPGGIVHVTNARTEAAATAINARLLEAARALDLLPPLIAVDHEGGSVQRVADVANLGSNRDFAARGAGERDACERGAVHARQLRAMGFSMNLAPVL